MNAISVPAVEPILEAGHLCHVESSCRELRVDFRVCGAWTIQIPRILKTFVYIYSICTCVVYLTLRGGGPDQYSILMFVNLYDKKYRKLTN